MTSRRTCHQWHHELCSAVSTNRVHTTRVNGARITRGRCVPQLLIALSLLALAPLHLAAQRVAGARDTVPVTDAATVTSTEAAAYRAGVLPLLERALLSNDSTAYDRVVAYVGAGLARYPNDPVLLHYRGFALFRKASVLTATGGAKGPSAKQAKALFEEADRAFERSAEGLAWPETLALRSAITGQLISFGSAFTAMRMGSRAGKQMEEALAVGPNNPRVWMLRGVGDLYRPRLFGGGLDKAESHLRHAIQLFATDRPPPPAPSWGQAEVYGWLGQVLAKQGKRSEARAAYEKGLSLEPGNAWIADYLIPALEKEGR